MFGIEFFGNLRLRYCPALKGGKGCPLARFRKNEVVSSVSNIFVSTIKDSNPTQPPKIKRKKIFEFSRQNVTFQFFAKWKQIMNFNAKMIFLFVVADFKNTYLNIGAKHIVRKVKFLSKDSILTSFSPNFFWLFFSWNQSCQQLKSPKPQHFHEFFTQIGSTIFSGNQSWIFGQKLKISNSVRGWYWHSYFKYLSS